MNDKAATSIRANVNPGWRLKSQSDWLPDLEIPIDKSGILGRDKNCTIVIPSGYVSRQHARLRIVGKQLEVIDLNSENGTFLNDVPIDKCMAKPGDILRFDALKLKVIGPEFDPQATQLRQPANLSDPSPESQPAEWTGATQASDGNTWTEKKWVLKPTCEGNRHNTMQNMRRNMKKKCTGFSEWLYWVLAVPVVTGVFLSLYLFAKG
ncbi:MAG: FHA domain-containing protein [Pseudomonadales bacterium]